MIDYEVEHKENMQFFKKQIKEDEELLKQIKKYVVVPYKDWDWKNKTNFKKVEEVNEFLLAQLENKRQKINKAAVGKKKLKKSFFRF